MDARSHPPSRLWLSVFHFIGVFSALTWFLVLVLFLPDMLRGDFQHLRHFFKTYRGIEPFVIVMAPIVLVIGPVWVWRVIARRKGV